jgi:hypothetical protein
MHQQRPGLTRARLALKLRDCAVNPANNPELGSLDCFDSLAVPPSPAVIDAFDSLFCLTLPAKVRHLRHICPKYQNLPIESHIGKFHKTALK